MGRAIPISQGRWAAILRGDLLGIFSTRAAARSAIRAGMAGGTLDT